MERHAERRSGRRTRDDTLQDRRSESRSCVSDKQGRPSLPSSVSDSSGSGRARHKEKDALELNGSSGSLLELGRESERRIRRQSLAQLPSSDSYRFQVKEKERYVRNMHLLIVTARSEIRKLKSEVVQLEERLKSHSVVKCPECGHTFPSGENRVLPKHIRVLRGRLSLDLQLVTHQRMGRMWKTRAICVCCAKYRCSSNDMYQHLNGTYGYERCSEADNYYDEFGYRSACERVWDVDERGSSPSEWNKRYDPAGGDHHVYLAINTTTGMPRFGRSDESTPANKGRRASGIRCEKGEKTYRLIENLSDAGAEFAESVFISLFKRGRRTTNKRAEYVQKFPPQFTIKEVGAKRMGRSPRIRVSWEENGEVKVGNPYDKAQLLAAKILKRILDKHQLAPFPDPSDELLPDSELDEDLQQMAASLDDELSKIEEAKEQLAAQEEAIQRKRRWLHHENAQR